MVYGFLKIRRGESLLEDYPLPLWGGASWEFARKVRTRAYIKELRGAIESIHD